MGRSLSAVAAALFGCAFAPARVSASQCAVAADCPAGNDCVAGFCVAHTPGGDCSTAADCAPGEVCRPNVCRPRVVCPADVQPTLSSLRAKLFDVGCGTRSTTGCHSAEGAGKSGAGTLLDFTADHAALHAALLLPATNIGSCDSNGDCAPDAGTPDGGFHPLRVDPGHPDAASSFLVQKLTLPATSPYWGVPMPYGDPGAVCDATVNVVQQWIEDGAKDD